MESRHPAADQCAGAGIASLASGSLEQILARPFARLANRTRKTIPRPFRRVLVNLVRPDHVKNDRRRAAFPQTKSLLPEVGPGGLIPLFCLALCVTHSIKPSTSAIRNIRVFP